MTPINPAAGGSLPRVPSTQPADAAPARSRVPATRSTDAYVAAPSTRRDAGPSDAYRSAVTGAQGAQAAPTATIRDLAATGIYSSTQLAEIEALGMTPEELGGVHEAAVEWARSADAAGRGGDQATPVAGSQPAVTGGGARSTDPVVSAPAPTSAPATASGSTATLADVEDVGIFTPSELREIASSGMSPEELGAFRDGAIEFARQSGVPVPADVTGTQPASTSQVGVEGASPDEMDAAAGIATTPVRGAQPAPGVQDFAALGLFTDAELRQLASYPPDQRIGIYREAVAFVQSPEYAQRATAAQAQSAGATSAATSTGEPAWSKEWSERFDDMLEEQGLNSKARLAVIGSMRAMPLDEAQLKQALEYYATSPEGAAELRAVEQQVAKATTMQNTIMLTMGGAALGAVAVTGAVGSSRGNLLKALERTAASSSADRASVAAKAVAEIKAGRPLTTTMRADIQSTLRAEAAATNRALHPVAKASLNGGARHVTPSARLSGSELIKYGLWMKQGDAVTDAAKAASTVAGGADDVARAAGGAAQAASGARAVGTFAKFLGPIGLVASAGFGAYGIKKTMEAEGKFGEESARMTGSVAGGLAGGVGGAMAGAAAGAFLGPIGAGVGAIAGGIAGSIGLGKVGESVGGFIHGLFD